MRVEPSNHKFDRILTEGLKTFSMTLAALARADDDVYELVAVKSDTGVYVPGERFPVGFTFCRSVVETGEPIAECRLGNSPRVLHHPLYLALPLECYIGAPVYRHGQIWGCVDFTSLAQRDAPFTVQDLKRIADLGSQISTILDSD